VSRAIAAKMLPFDFHRQKGIEFRLQIRTKINTGVLSLYVIQIQIPDVRKAFDSTLNAPMKIHLEGDCACEVPPVCLDHTHDQWLQIHGESRSFVKEFVEKSYPVVFVARCEIFAEHYRGGIDCAPLAYLPEIGFIPDN
jgi:hypothetical protein